MFTQGILMREKIFKYVKEKYNIEPDYPFSTAPTYPVLRHADNRKWFALIMDVQREKLGLKGTDYVDIINLKLGDPMLVDMIVQKASREGITDMTFTVSRKDVKRAVDIVEEVRHSIGGECVETDLNVAKVSVIGVGMRNHSGVAARAFGALHQADININMISTSEIKISCLIDEREVEKAVQTLHKEFNLRLSAVEAQ